MPEVSHNEIIREMREGHKAIQDQLVAGSKRMTKIEETLTNTVIGLTKAEAAITANGENGKQAREEVAAVQLSVDEVRKDQVQMKEEIAAGKGAVWLLGILGVPTVAVSGVLVFFGNLFRNGGS